ncbi:MAG: phosphatidate cytidylyltransferase [Pseudomonadota bacterium]
MPEIAGLAAGKVVSNREPERHVAAKSPDKAAKKSDLKPRVLSALVMIPCALYALYSGGMLWAALIALSLAAMSAEWADIVFGKNTTRAPKLLFVAATMVIFVLCTWHTAQLASAVALGTGLLVFGAGAAVLGRPAKWAGFGLSYLSIAAIALYWLRAQTGQTGMILVFFLLIVVWATDIGAYFAGRKIGGPKIFPAISPNKTWSGSIGGVLSATACAACISLVFMPNTPLLLVCMLAIGLSIVAQAGDAFESAMKRIFKVKDSGSIIPGHGGVLDRLDALLLAAPVMAAFIWVNS